MAVRKNARPDPADGAQAQPVVPVPEARPLIEHPSILLAGVAARASLATDHRQRLLNKPPLSQLRASPLSAQRTGASDDHSPSRSSSDPRGSAVEAGRPANLSEPGCDCPVCTSDLADIAPCQRENEE
ncbi:hypothetical protein [Sphingobium sp. Cam5-1]|uniref:hypothetical protein n=1 Tax=Sphingobium sp. Cam5-1 TaxID=2789327 RepID=UPI0018AD1FE3|nr:hypothetical protein [Sphingobium sp. Cam5-1]QPI73903.1 hypothetical protein IZV00_05410 [Sphingobium sp. Cam5-1]